MNKSFRYGRGQYALCVIGIIAALFAIAIISPQERGFYIVWGGIALIIASIPRLRDCNKSAWWAILTALPLTSIFAVIYLLLKKGANSQ